MENQNTMRVINLEDLWGVFKHHIFPIVLSAVMCVAILFAYSTYILTPKYSSTSTLYILKQENSNDYVYTQADFTLALNVVNDCTYMVKSHEVLDRVINKLNLDMDYKKLYNSITINNPENTRVLEITVETENAEQSRRIVDEICRTSAEKINSIMGADQVNVYSKGIVGAVPSNSLGLTVYVMAGIITAVLMFAIYIISFMLDDKIKTEEDVEKYLGLSVLGNIPNSNDSKRKNGKYGYYGSYYGKNNVGKNSKGGKAK